MNPLLSNNILESVNSNSYSLSFSQLSSNSLKANLTKQLLLGISDNISTTSDSKIDVLAIIGLICNIVQPLIYLAPIRCFIKMISEHITEKIPIYYFLFNIIQSFLWVIVAIEKLDIAILTANLVGAVFFTTFFAGYLIISSKKDLLGIMIKINALFLVIVFFLFACYNFISYDICAVLCVIMESSCYLSILQYIKEVFMYEDTSYIDFFIVVSIFVVTFWWLVYAIVEWNIVLFIPNIIGFATSSFVLSVNYHFATKIRTKEIVKSL